MDVEDELHIKPTPSMESEMPAQDASHPPPTITDSPSSPANRLTLPPLNLHENDEIDENNEGKVMKFEIPDSDAVSAISSPVKSRESYRMEFRGDVRVPDIVAALGVAEDLGRNDVLREGYEAVGNDSGGVTGLSAGEDEGVGCKIVDDAVVAEEGKTNENRDSDKTSNVETRGHDTVTAVDADVAMSDGIPEELRSTLGPADELAVEYRSQDKAPEDIDEEDEVLQSIVLDDASNMVAEVKISPGTNAFQVSDLPEISNDERDGPMSEDADGGEYLNSNPAEKLSAEHQSIHFVPKDGETAAEALQSAVPHDAPIIVAKAKTSRVMGTFQFPLFRRSPSEDKDIVMDDSASASYEPPVTKESPGNYDCSVITDGLVEEQNVSEDVQMDAATVQLRSIADSDDDESLDTPESKSVDDPSANFEETVDTERVAEEVKDEQEVIAKTEANVPPSTTDNVDEEITDDSPFPTLDTLPGFPFSSLTTTEIQKENSEITSSQDDKTFQERLLANIDNVELPDASPANGTLIDLEMSVDTEELAEDMEKDYNENVEAKSIQKAIIADSEDEEEIPLVQEPENILEPDLQVTQKDGLTAKTAEQPGIIAESDDDQEISIIPESEKAAEPEPEVTKKGRRKSKTSSKPVDNPAEKVAKKRGRPKKAVSEVQKPEPVEEHDDDVEMNGVQIVDEKEDEQNENTKPSLPNLGTVPKPTNGLHDEDAAVHFNEPSTPMSSSPVKIKSSPNPSFKMPSPVKKSPTQSSSKMILSSPSRPTSFGASQENDDQGSSSQDAVLAELKAMKIASIQARISALKEEIAVKKEKRDELSKGLTQSAAETVKTHIKLLHDYNDIKDIGQGLVGMIADQRGLRIGELYQEFGVDVKD